MGVCKGCIVSFQTMLDSRKTPYWLPHVKWGVGYRRSWEITIIVFTEINLAVNFHLI